MWFMWLLGWVALALQFLFATLAVAAGLYYLAELIEEFTSAAAKAIKAIILAIIAIYFGFMLFEEFPLTMNVCGILAQIVHLLVMKTFPYFIIYSPSFILTLLFTVVNHYLAFQYFSSYNYPFVQILAYFTLCLWVVPFSFFVSLSANDYVLPTRAESYPLLSSENDVVSKYFSKKGKKYGLLTFFHAAKDYVLPQRVKKSF